MAHPAPPLPSSPAADAQASRAATPPAARLCLFCVRPVLDDTDRCAAFAQADQEAHRSCCGCAAWPDPPRRPPARSPQRTPHIGQALAAWLAAHLRRLHGSVKPKEDAP